MSMELINLAVKLVREELTADEFETQFLHTWRDEGNAGMLSKDSKAVGECASELFILADCYTSDSTRRESELSPFGLKKEVEQTLKKYKFI